MTHINVWGQTVNKGNWVGWGGRDGNGSTRKVGVVEDFKPVVHQRWDTLLRRFIDLPPVQKVQVTWYSQHRPYKSWVQVDDVFLLDPDTIKLEIRDRYVPF